MLTELSGQSSDMSKLVLKGFVTFTKLIFSWLKEAEHQGLLKDGLDLNQISNFIVISLNGAAPLYAATRNPIVWQQTTAQLHYYINSLRN